MEGGCPVDFNTITDLFLQVSHLFFFLTFSCYALAQNNQNMFNYFLPQKNSLEFHWLSFLFLFLILFLLLVQRNLIREATAFLLDVLKPNLPEHGYLQTKVKNFLFQEFSL